MYTLLICLGIISIIFIIVSFFLPDRTSELKEEIDALSIQHYQETYQLKKRIKILEEELLIPNNFPIKKRSTKSFNPIITNQVLLLNKQGLTTEQIARQSALSIEDVVTILQQHEGWNKHD
jgi:hypothetical protein